MGNTIEKYRLDLINFVKNKFNLNGGFIQSNIPYLDLYTTTSPSEFISTMYEPSLCIILQGKKSVGFGNNLYEYDKNRYLLSSTHIPAKVKITKASEELPYISFRIRFTLEDIYEVLKHTKPEKLQFTKKSEKGLFFDNLSEKLYEPAYRLVKLLDSPKEDIEYLSSFIIKELLYNLVNDKSGYFINKFATEGTTSNKIVKVITEIKNNFNEKINVKELADSIEMSESSLYQNFKTITSMSPIQFQKKIRLEEAKNMLLVRDIDASEAAFLVGYESPSQFSREYSRMFGMSPKAHLKYLKSTEDIR